MAWVIRHKLTGEVIMSGDGEMADANLKVANLEGANLALIAHGLKLGKIRGLK